MKKPVPNSIPPEWLAESDTGIYYDPPKQYYPLNTWKDWQAFERRTKAETIFNLESQLSEAEQYTRKILERYIDNSQDSPELFEQWKSYVIACRQNKKDAENLKPAIPYRAGFPRLPSKKDGIPDNVKRQVDYAKNLLAQISITRAAVEKGEAQKAAIYAYWVGRYWEALRVLRVEWVALAERKQ